MSFRYRTQTMVMPAGSQREIEALAYFVLLSATGAIHISASANPDEFGLLPPRVRIAGTPGIDGLPRPLGKLTLSNLTGGSVTLVWLTTNGQVGDDRTSEAGGTQAVEIASVTTNVPVIGAAAHAAAVVGAPLLLGAEGLNAERAAVANGQAVRMAADLAGRQVVLPCALPEQSFFANVSLAVVGAVVARAAPGAGLRIYLTAVTLTNPAASANTGTLLDGAAQILNLALAANASIAAAFPVPVRLSAATALNFNISAATQMIVHASGYVGR